MSVKPLKGLELRTNFGLDYGNFFRRDLNKKYESGKLKNDVNSVKLNQGHWLKWNWNATATYQFEIGKHRMDVLAGVELFKEQNTDFAAYREGFEVETPETMVYDWIDDVRRMGNEQSFLAMPPEKERQEEEKRSSFDEEDSFFN